MTGILSSVVSYLFPVKRGQNEDFPLVFKAVPGLTTVLDVALFRSMEGQLTATIHSSHTLLACWLDVKHQAQLVLQSLREEEDENPLKQLYESFARQSLECACDAMERLGTDRMAQAANLTDAYESVATAAGGGGGHHHNPFGSLMTATSGVGVQGINGGILESKGDTGRRQPMQQRQDCWESPRLYCPDFMWADDAYLACQRWVRALDKHPFMTMNSVENLELTTNAKHSKGGGAPEPLSSSSKKLMPGTERQTTILRNMIQDDIPLRLYQFKQAMEAEVVVTKRLYLVKSEYRVPFRSFLEAHQSLLRAPPIELVDYYLEQSNDPKSDNDKDDGPEDLKAEFQSLLHRPELIEMLALERECEELELALGEALFPFSELARSLDHRRARLKVVREVVEYDELPTLQEQVRRLKYVLCRKAGSSEMSTGIRPILLDLQMIPRDDEPGGSSATASGVYSSASTLEERIEEFIDHLTTLSNLVKTKNAFVTTKAGGSGHSSSDSIEFSLPVVKGCTEEYDPELLKCRMMDWFAMVDRQHELQILHKDLPSQIQEAEMKMSIAGASYQALKMVKERLTTIQNDRQQRFEVLKEMVEEVCLREMNIFVHLTEPNPREVLELKRISAPGFLGVPLEIAGEPLPLG